MTRVLMRCYSQFKDNNSESNSQLYCYKCYMYHCCYSQFKDNNSESNSQLTCVHTFFCFVVIVSSKIIILKAIHNSFVYSLIKSGVVIVSSKIIILKAIHNHKWRRDYIGSVVIVSSKIIILKAIHNFFLVHLFILVLLQLVQR